MFQKEAQILGEYLGGIPALELSPLVNIGSSGNLFRERTRPWADRKIFTPLRGRGVKIAHVDIEAGPRVDLVADILTDDGLETIRRIKPKMVLLTNVLEHVYEPRKFAQRCLTPGAAAPASQLRETLRLDARRQAVARQFPPQKNILDSPARMQQISHRNHSSSRDARPASPAGFFVLAEPLTYDSEIAGQICARMTKGETLRTICADAAMPSPAAVLSWAAEDIDGFAERFARAREALIECWAQEIIDISDDGTNDWLEREGRKQTTRAPNAEHIQRSKLRVDARKWLISKLAPKKFGDKPAVASDKGAPVTVQIVRFADDEQS